MSTKSNGFKFSGVQVPITAKEQEPLHSALLKATPRGDLLAFAEKCNLDPTNISDMRSKKRAITTSVAIALGFQPKVVYVPRSD